MMCSIEIEAKHFVRDCLYYKQISLLRSVQSSPNTDPSQTPIKTKSSEWLISFSAKQLKDSLLVRSCPCEERGFLFILIFVHHQVDMLIVLMG